MFTGIITHLGLVAKKTADTLVIKVPDDFHKKTRVGTSVSVDGICLTVAKIEKPHVSMFNFMPETSRKTNIAYLQRGNLVNLELSVTAETFLAGHIVQGHVDGVSRILNMQEEGNSHIFTLAIDRALSKYVVHKGAIALNGISLTVIKAQTTQFTVGIIPHTWKRTMLHTINAGDAVNIEVDVLAKYVEKLISPYKPSTNKGGTCKENT
ncbi:riboflavin synthase [Candidatus Gottesmanbacteria bacterium]|nr:riboflavin synthase [Candidatus Gottesmanbacteria bacterium]